MRIIAKILNKFGFVKVYKSNRIIDSSEFKMVIACAETRCNENQRLPNSEHLEREVLKQNLLKAIENHIEYKTYMDEGFNEFIFTASLKLAIPKK